jgi:hypothetical protein
MSSPTLQTLENPAGWDVFLSVVVCLVQRKSYTERMIDEVNAESSESLEQFLMGRRDRLLAQPLAAVAERGFPPAPQVDLRDIPTVLRTNAEGQGADDGQPDTQRRFNEYRDPTRCVSISILDKVMHESRQSRAPPTRARYYSTQCTDIPQQTGAPGS